MKSYEFTFLANYSQFLLRDAADKEGVEAQWTESAYRDRLALGDTELLVGTVEPFEVHVVLDVCEAQPPSPNDLNPFYQVVECNLRLPSGKLLLMDVFDYLPEVTRVSVSPGSQRVRIYYLKPDNSTLERFRIHIWPQFRLEPTVFLKKDQRYARLPSPCP